MAVALVVALLLAGAVSVWTGWAEAAGRSLQSLANGQVGPHTAPISTTVWYAGEKIAFGPVACDGSEQVTVDAAVECVAAADCSTDLPLSLTIAGRAYPGHTRSIGVLQPGTKADATFAFQVPRLTRRLSTATLAVGRADEAQATIPLNGTGSPTTLQPRQVLTRTSGTLRDLQYDVDSCEIGAGYLSHPRQSDAGHRVLACHITVTLTGAASVHPFGSHNLAVVLADGTEINGTYGWEISLRTAGPPPRNLVEFPIPEPARGPCTLRLTDLHGTETLAPAWIADIEINM